MNGPSNQNPGKNGANGSNGNFGNGGGGATKGENRTSSTPDYAGNGGYGGSGGWGAGGGGGGGGGGDWDIEYAPGENGVGGAGGDGFPYGGSIYGNGRAGLNGSNTDSNSGAGGAGGGGSGLGGAVFVRDGAKAIFLNSRFQYNLAGSGRGGDSNGYSGSGGGANLYSMSGATVEYGAGTDPSSINGGDGTVTSYPVPLVAIYRDSEDSVSESTQNIRFRILLTSSAIDVDVNYSFSGTAIKDIDYDSLSGSITVPAGTTAVYLDINVIDDEIDEPDETITVSLEDSVYYYSDKETATITIDDDDTAGITVTSTSGTTTEVGEQTNFQFKLNSKPLSNVTINFSHNSDEGTLSTSSLTFTPSNWNSYQTLTVTGQDDNDYDDDQIYTITTTVSSSDSKYDDNDGDSVPDLTITNINDDFNEAPIVANPIADRNIQVGQSLNFQFAANSFDDINEDPLTYTASLADGGNLPSWLDFAPNTRTFSSNTNPTVDDIDILEIKVTASDSEYSVSDNFYLAVVNTVVDNTHNHKGSQDDNAVAGDGSKDIIRGDDGDDLIFGHNEADRLFGERGRDKLFGGDGDDNIHGGEGQDELNGGSGKDKLFGAEDRDTLTGSEGNDVLHGGVGDDFLDGGAGIDYLKGGEGNDTLYGGAGSDRIRGNEGNDVFVLTDDDTNNIIFDYVDGEDKLALELSSFTNNTVVDVLNNELTISQNGNNSEIYANSGIDPLAVLSNVTYSDLTVEDFISF